MQLHFKSQNFSILTFFGNLTWQIFIEDLLCARLFCGVKKK